MLTSLKKLPRKFLILATVAFILGVGVAFGARLVLVDRQDTHYHANLALYINGVRDEFKDFTYYEEIAACNVNDTHSPNERVHMHSSVGHVVHVHAKAMTWGSFFANLGYTLGNEVISTKDGVFINGQNGEKLRFYINGNFVTSIANEVIHSEDRLLIDYSADGEAVLKTRYDSVEVDAHVYNEEIDPSSCSGSAAESLKGRIQRTLGINGND